jgi:hypothetical protein
MAVGTQWQNSLEKSLRELVSRTRFENSLRELASGARFENSLPELASRTRFQNSLPVRLRPFLEKVFLEKFLEKIVLFESFSRNSR